MELIWMAAIALVPFSLVIARAARRQAGEGRAGTRGKRR